MKKLLVLVALMLATTSFAFSQTQCLLTTITESLPNFPVGQPMQFDIEVCCGNAPYHFQVVDGTLPEGLHLNQNGKITGKAVAEADTTVFIQITDASGCSLVTAYAVRATTP